MIVELPVVRSQFICGYRPAAEPATAKKSKVFRLGLELLPVVAEIEVNEAHNASREIQNGIAVEGLCRTTKRVPQDVKEQEGPSAQNIGGYICQPHGDVRPRLSRCGHAAMLKVSLFVDSPHTEFESASPLPAPLFICLSATHQAGWFGHFRRSRK